MSNTTFIDEDHGGWKCVQQNDDMVQRLFACTPHDVPPEPSALAVVLGLVCLILGFFICCWIITWIVLCGCCNHYKNCRRPGYLKRRRELQRLRRERQGQEEMLVQAANERKRDQPAVQMEDHKLQQDIEQLHAEARIGARAQGALRSSDEEDDFSDENVSKIDCCGASQPVQRLFLSHRARAPRVSTGDMRDIELSVHLTSARADVDASDSL